LHPEDQVNNIKALECLETAVIPGVHSSCKDLTVQWIKEKCVFGGENDIIKAAVKELIHKRGILVTDIVL